MKILSEILINSYFSIPFHMRYLECYEIKYCEYLKIADHMLAYKQQILLYDANIVLLN